MAIGLVDASVNVMGKAADGEFVQLCTLQGHKNWVNSVDFCRGGVGGVVGMLATASHDTYIRVWKIMPSPEEAAARRDQEPHEPGGGESLGLVKRPAAVLSMTQKRHVFRLPGHPEQLCMQLEAVLAGHEDRVNSVRWTPPHLGPVEQPSLLSSSMDKTLQLWRPDASDGVWSAFVRVGDIGGQPGALSFYGACFTKGFRGLLGHSHNGALQAWEGIGEPGASGFAEGAWERKLCVSGHFQPVQDLCWEGGGHYLVSVSDDQTARLFSEWSEGAAAAQRAASVGRARRGWLGEGHGVGSCFLEVARTQVHGYDLRCLSFLRSCSHAYVCGADDEKVLRVLMAPKTFVESLSQISGARAAADPGSPERDDSATLPPLGLSNKPVSEAVPPAAVGGSTPMPTTGAEREEGEEDLGALGVDPYMLENQGPQIAAQVLEAPPTEEMLVQSTLWPEKAKLYGHGNPVFSVCVSNGGRIVASSCKAAESQQGLAGIRMWDTSNWLQCGLLEGHKLTVTQIAFSPDDSRILSVSRDRSLCIFTREADSEIAYKLSRKVEKAHERVIWACAWSPCGNFFVTASRDKCVRVWRAEGDAISTLPKFPGAATSVDWTVIEGRQALAVGTEEGHISVWTALDATAVWEEAALLGPEEMHCGSVTRIRWRPTRESEGGAGGRGGAVQLASCGLDHSVRVYDVKV